MPDQWRHMLELSIELEKLDGGGNYREGQSPVHPRAVRQRQAQPGPQTRPVIEHQNHLARILDVIPVSPNAYQPNQPRLPARQDVIPAPRRDYQTNPSRLPARQDEYIARGYARRVTQIDVLPMAQDWRPRPAEVRKPLQWRNYMVASCFGAVVGISGYAFLSQSGTGKGTAPKTAAPVTAVAAAVQEARAEPKEAFPERVPNQLNRGNVSGTAMGYGYTAQPAGAPFLELASNQLNRREVPRPQAADTMAPSSDDTLLEQASYKLNLGDALGARAIYEKIAQRGSLQGAFGVAETYDPSILARHRVQGLKPDPKLARMWYERAAKLGSLEASKRLKQLAKRSPAMSSPKPVASSSTISSGSEVLRR